MENNTATEHEYGFKVLDARGNVLHRDDTFADYDAAAAACEAWMQAEETGPDVDGYVYPL